MKKLNCILNIQSKNDNLIDARENDHPSVNYELEISIKRAVPTALTQDPHH